MTEKEYKYYVALFEKHKREETKQEAFERHKKACRWVTKYNLPYRVSLDYLKQYNSDSGIVLINRAYPLPGLPAAGLLTMTLEEAESAAGRERIEKNNEQYYTWNLETAAGVKVWEREFTHFLIGYDVSNFTMFDMFGRTDLTVEALEDRKRYYIGLQERFKSDIGQFRTQEPPYLPEYREQYTDDEYIRRWTEEEAARTAAVLLRMGVDGGHVEKFLTDIGHADLPLSAAYKQAGYERRGIYYESNII